MIQRAEPEDWQRVRDLRLRSLRDAPDAFWTDVEEEAAVTPEQWQQRLSDPRRVTLLAVDGEDVGLAVVGPSHGDPSHAGLSGMWVAPRRRGSGVADALLAAAVEWARASGYPCLRLWVNDANTAAARLYERHGFVPTGVTGSFRPPREHITEHERALDL